jgi:hypothetical protein
LAILKRHGSSRIALVSLQRKFIVMIQVWSRLTVVINKTHWTGHQELWNFGIWPRHIKLLY